MGDLIEDKFTCKVAFRLVSILRLFCFFDFVIVTVEKPDLQLLLRRTAGHLWKLCYC